MSYVYADIDALRDFKERIEQTRSVVEGQIGCKDDLIEQSKIEIRAAIERAEEVERQAYTALRNAEDALHEEEQRTRSYNANLAEDQEPITTPEYYYDMVDQCERDYSYAQANREHAENTLANFEEYVRHYRQQQADAIEHFRKLLEMNSKFIESYADKLMEVKKATAVSGSNSGGGSGSAGAAVGGAGNGVSASEAIKAEGKQWTESLTKEQYAAFSAYTGTAYININETLRGLCSDFHSGNKEKAMLIHQALSTCSLPQACTVYRGASNAYLGSLQNLSDSQLEGKYFCDNGFMSTSINPGDAFGGEIKLVINVPAGAKGAYLGYLSQLGHSESEVLFDVGSVMRITKVTRDQNGRRVIYADLM